MVVGQIDIDIKDKIELIIDIFESKSKKENINLKLRKYKNG